MPRVLLAEDNKLNQIVAAGTRRKLGYDIEIVDGGVDAVLMDVMMPDLDGYAATSQIRALETERGGFRTPIIGLSARAMTSRPPLRCWRPVIEPWTAPCAGSCPRRC